MPEQVTVDTAKAQAKIDALKQHLKQYIGKPGFNSYVYVHENLKPYEDAIMAGKLTQTQYDKLMALNDKPEPIAKGAEINAKNPPQQAAASGMKELRTEVQDEVHMQGGAKI